MQRFALPGDPAPSKPHDLSALSFLDGVTPELLKQVSPLRHGNIQIDVRAWAGIAIAAIQNHRLPTPETTAALLFVFQCSPLRNPEFQSWLADYLGADCPLFAVQFALEYLTFLNIHQFHYKLLEKNMMFFWEVRAICCGVPDWKDLLIEAQNYADALSTRYRWAGEVHWLLGFLFPDAHIAKTRHTADPVEFLCLTGSALKQRIENGSNAFFVGISPDIQQCLTRTLLHQPNLAPLIVTLALRTQSPALLFPFVETPLTLRFLCQGFADPTFRPHLKPLFNLQDPLHCATLRAACQNSDPSIALYAKHFFEPPPLAINIPSFLSAPPWLSNKRLPALTLLDQPLQIPFMEYLAWDETQCHALASQQSWLHHHPEALSLARQVVSTPMQPRPSPLLLLGLCVLPIEEAILSWEFSNSETKPVQGWQGYREHLHQFFIKIQLHENALVTGQLAHLESFIRFATLEPDLGFSLLHAIASPRIVPLVAKMLGNRGPKRHLAATWLTLWPEAAAAGLIPAALNGDKAPSVVRARKDAILCLKRMISLGFTQIIEQTAQDAGVAALLKASLNHDPLLLCPTRFKARPGWWDPQVLMAPQNLDHEQLPLEAVAAIGDMFAFSEPDRFYAGIDKVAEICTPASLEAMCLDAFRCWRHADEDASERWILRALGRFGQTQAALLLGEALQSWGERPALIMDGWMALAQMGHDTALRVLARRVADASGNRKTVGEQILRDAAALRGLNTEDLEDQLVDPLDLSDMVDGSQRYPVVLDPLGNLSLNISGQYIENLPKKSGKEAMALWRTRKKQHATSWKREAKRLEQALITQRCWSIEGFEHAIGHPLLGGLAKRLLWSSPSQPKGFRVTEDGSLADLNDNLTTLTEPIRLLHPANIDPLTRSTWQQILADYKLIQPFPQLSRDYHLLEPEWHGRPFLPCTGLQTTSWQTFGPQWCMGEMRFQGEWYHTTVFRPLGAFVLRIHLGPPTGATRMQPTLTMSLHRPDEEMPCGGFEALEAAHFSELMIELRPPNI